MTIVLKTVDQVPGAPTVEGPELSFQVGQVTAREIIRARVTSEVDATTATPAAEIRGPGAAARGRAAAQPAASRAPSAP